MICRKTMAQCQTPGICAPFGGCQDPLQSQLAAFREELATAKRNEHNSEVAYKAAIEKQEELRAELSESEEELDTVIHHNIDLQQRLADAERRNAEMLNWLRRQANAEKGSTERSVFIESYNALKKISDPKPEAASHEN